MVTKLSASGSKPTIQEHLQRAKELGVTLEECCGAYSADIEAMLEEERRMAREDSSASKPTPGKLNDFVKVQVLPDAPCSEQVSSPARVCCRLRRLRQSCKNLWLDTRSLRCSRTKKIP